MVVDVARDFLSLVVSIADKNLIPSKHSVEDLRRFSKNTVTNIVSRATCKAAKFFKRKHKNPIPNLTARTPSRFSSFHMEKDVESRYATVRVLPCSSRAHSSTCDDAMLYVYMFDRPRMQQGFGRHRYLCAADARR